MNPRLEAFEWILYKEGKGQWGPKWRGKAAWRVGLPVHLEDEVGLSKAESRKIVYGLREELQELAQLVVDTKAARNRAEGGGGQVDGGAR